jgi:hypothetical protein
MTDPRVDRAARPPRGRGAFWATWTTIAVFLAVLALLAVRVAAGQDPALRSRAGAAPLPPRRILVRRIYERRVIVHLPPSAPPLPSRSSQQVSSAGSSPEPPAVTRAS